MSLTCARNNTKSPALWFSSRIQNAQAHTDGYLPSHHHRFVRTVVASALSSAPSWIGSWQTNAHFGPRFWKDAAISPCLLLRSAEKQRLYQCCANKANNYWQDNSIRLSSCATKVETLYVTKLTTLVDLNARHHWLDGTSVVVSFERTLRTIWVRPRWSIDKEEPWRTRS